MHFEPIGLSRWERAENFTHYLHENLQKGYAYLKPIFTIGKYMEQNGHHTLPLAVQVHHAVCEGFHDCRFVNEVQETLDNGPG